MIRAPAYENNPRLAHLLQECELTRLLERKRVLAETEEIYNLQETQYTTDMQNFLQQEERFRETDALMQQRFVRGRRQIVENQEKRRRAEQHLNDERRGRTEKLREIEGQRHRVLILDEQREALEKGVSELAPLEDCLAKAVAMAPELFATLPELLQRFSNLQKINAKLRNNEQELSERLARLTATINAREKEHSTAALLAGNRLAELQKQAEILETRTAAFKSEVESSEQTAEEKARRLARLMLSIDDIHELALKFNALCFKGQETATQKPNVNSRSDVEENKGEYMTKIAVIEACLAHAVQLSTFTKMQQQN